VAQRIQGDVIDLAIFHTPIIIRAMSRNHQTRLEIQQRTIWFPFKENYLMKISNDTDWQIS
jgi:hypothetical protein